MTATRLKEIIEVLETEWGEAGSRVIELCWANRCSMTFDKFMSHCTCCGGNWGGMFLSGINSIEPAIYEAIPDDMGVNAFLCIAMVLELMGIEV